MPLLKPLGDIESYRFADWRNQAVSLSDRRCASAIYSRAGTAYVLLANLDSSSKEVSCVLHPGKLPCPLARLASASRLAAWPGAKPPHQVPDALAGLEYGSFRRSESSRWFRGASRQAVEVLRGKSKPVRAMQLHCLSQIMADPAE